MCYVGRRSRDGAVRRVARRAAREAAGDGRQDSVDTVVDLGGGITVFGSSEFVGGFMSDVMGPAAERLGMPDEVSKAQKTEAPCDGCGRVMRAADRCMGCRMSGVWYCAACHAEYEGF